MALVFSLSIECGTKGSADAMAAYFGALTLRLASRDVQCRVFSREYPDSNWWVQVCVPGISTKGPLGHDPELCERACITAAGGQLLEHLRGAPSFRYALVGVEADDFRRFGEIDDDLAILNFHGLVINDTIWQRLGAATVFEPFRDGYRWRPYKGEGQGL